MLNVTLYFNLERFRVSQNDSLCLLHVFLFFLIAPYERTTWCSPLRMLSCLLNRVFLIPFCLHSLEHCSIEQFPKTVSIDLFFPAILPSQKRISQCCRMMLIFSMISANCWCGLFVFCPFLSLPEFVYHWFIFIMSR